MRRSPTIYDVAERAGVSKSLVSLVLRGSPRVSDEKREAVLAAVAELDYTPSRLAAGLAGTRTRSIGVVIDEFENLWFAPALAGLRSALGAGGYSLSVADAALNAHLGLDPLEVFRSLRVDGVVLAGEVPDEAARRLAVPAVVLGTRALRLPGAPLIASDEFAGGRLATAHLAELGHRDIACVTGPGASAAAREAGYLAEMRDRGLSPRVARAAQTTEAAAREVAAGMFEAGAREAGGSRAGSGAGSGADDGTGAMTGSGAVTGAGSGVRQGAEARGAAAARRPGAGADPVPTAVFAVNDPMAVGVIGAARDRGLEVPSGLSVVGYDDSPLAAYDFISLTSVSGDPRELGEAAGRALVALLEGDAASGSVPGPALEPEPEPASLLAPRLAVRGSAAAPRA